MFERFTASARTAVLDARSEADRRGDRRIGTEHLLLALLRDDALARAVGADAAQARRAADDLDRAALAAVGLDLGVWEPAEASRAGGRLPMTPGAKAVLGRTLATASAEKARHLMSRHLLLAVLDREDPDPAAALLDALSVDRDDARQRLELLTGCWRAGSA